jgi:hypothetical protein
MRYFKGGELAKTIEELIEMGYSGTGCKFQETFTDKEYTQLDCKRARRSFLELYDIVKTYFPTCTLSEFAYIIMKKSTCGLCLFYCGDIEKFVFEKYIPSQHTVISSNEVVDFVDHTGVSINYIKDLAKNYKPVTVPACVLMT